MIKYIIFGKNHYQYKRFDINRYVYHDAITQENVFYIEPGDRFWHRYLRFFYTNEYGIAIRKKLFIPFRRSAFKALLLHANKIKKQDRNIFVFFYAEPWFYDEKGFLKYLRDRYINGKLVYHLTNILQNTSKCAEFYQQYFDLVSTCNKGDSEKYHLPFFPNSCSFISFQNNSEPSSDCFFVGQAKNRLPDLLMIYDILTQKGIRCEFYINGVNETDMRFCESVHYNTVLDYDEILRKIEKTNVILELLQEGMDSHTLRYPEAVNYGKKLITNNSNVISERSYSEENIRIIREPGDVSAIDKSFFKSPIAQDYPNRDSVSSRNFLTFIKDNLEL